MSDAIHAVTMPKWGMDMADGTVNGWLVDEGAALEEGAEMAEVETTKIAGTIDAPFPCVLARQVAPVGSAVPVGGSIAVVTTADVSPDDVDAFVAGFEGPAAALAGEAAASDHSRIDTPFGEMRVRTLGDGGTPLVLLHGFGGDLDAWLFNHSALAERRITYAIELPGHGQSTKDVGDGSLATLAQAVGSVLDTLGVGPADLAGHSLGGAIALALALDDPARFSNVALVASAGLGVEIDGTYLDVFVAASRRKEMKPALEKLFADPGAVTRALVEEVLRNKRLDGAQTALERIRDAVFPGGIQSAVLGERISTLARPPLVVWGRDDQIIPPTHATALDGRCDVHVLDGAGHMVQMERAGEVNRLLERYFSD